MSATLGTSSISPTPCPAPQMSRHALALHCEVDDPLATDGEPAIVASIRELTKLRGDVQFSARGSLPSDGKVIDDARDDK